MSKHVSIYYGKKLLMFLLSIFVLSVIVFCMARLSPGDPVVAYYGDRAERMSVTEKEQVMERLGLNDSIVKQYSIWMKGALQGDFGISYKYKTNVLQVVNDRIGNTIWLGGISFVGTFLLALFLGMFCAMCENSFADKVLCKLGTISSSIPTFIVALLLILIFSVTLGWLPSSGAYAIGHSTSFASRMQHLILPLTTLVVTHVWYYAYMVRNRLLLELGQNYVLLAKAKGIKRFSIMIKHCLRNIAPMYISLVVVSIPHIIGGTYIVEMVFTYPGLGTLAFESAKYHDYNLLMVICLLTGIVVIMFNAIGKIVMESIDPRLKNSGVQ